MKHLFLLVFSTFFMSNSFGIKDSLELIVIETISIDRAETREVLIDWERLSEELDAYDGGAELLLKYDSTGLRKITYNVGLSYGSVFTTLYLLGGNPIKITQVESRFPWKEEESSLDYEVLNEVTRIDYYIFNWKENRFLSKQSGSENMQEPADSLLDFQYILDLVRKVVPQE